MWEPYTDNDMRQGMFLEKEIVMDWRKEFEKIWLKLNLYRKKWWKTKEQTSMLNILKPVSGLFGKEAKLIRQARRKRRKFEN